MKTYADKLVKVIYKIVRETPTVRSDRQRKRTMYLLMRNEVTHYKRKAEEERVKNSNASRLYARPSEDEIRIHIIDNLVTLGKLEQSMTSEQWGRHICEVVGTYEQSWK